MESPSDQLELYWFLGGQPSRAVKTLLDMGQIEHVEKITDFGKKEHREEWFDKMTEGHLTLPYLKVGDDFGISESASQLRYIATAYAEKLPAGIYPQELRKRIIVDKWLDWSLSYFRPTVHLYIDTTFAKDDADEKYDEKRTAAHKTCEEAVTKLDDYLKRAGTDFLTGDQVTIADILIFHEATSELMCDAPCVKEDAEKRPHLTAWRKRMIAIPAIGAINEKFTAILPGVITWLTS